jgi:hypothetical protein
MMGILAVKFPMISGFITVSGTSTTNPHPKDYWEKNINVQIKTGKRS